MSKESAKTNFADRMVYRVSKSKTSLREFVLSSILVENPEMQEYISVDPHLAINVDAVDNDMKFHEDQLDEWISGVQDMISRLVNSHEYEIRKMIADERDMEYLKELRKANIFDVTESRFASLLEELNQWDAPKSLSSVKEDALENIELSLAQREKYKNYSVPELKTPTVEEYIATKVKSWEERIALFEDEKEKILHKRSRKKAFLEALAKEFPAVTM